MILFSQNRSFDNILENCFFQISSYSRAYVSWMIYKKTKGQIPLGPLLRKQNIQAKEVYKSIIIAIVSGDTLGSLLCIYLKHMHEVQRLTSTSLRDNNDRIKYGRVPLSVQVHLWHGDCEKSVY